ncbi:MAG: amino acid ABC transporter permease [Eubacteriales bacterium]|nr:amino acid ABC transporter permease [Eubacteriales bacterium]
MPIGFINIMTFLFEKYALSFLRGAGYSLLLALVGTFFGTLIGLLCGIIMTIPISKDDKTWYKIIIHTIKFIINAYVEIFRGTPMMVQSMFIYFGASALFSINMDIMFAAFFIVSINTGAYMTETVRGGIISIDDGQFEGAKAIGMNHYQTMRYIILPQSLRNIMPQIGNNLIINIKDTCVLSVIGVVELFYASKGVAGAYYKYFETFTITMIIYFIMTFISSKILRFIESKMDGPLDYDLASTDTLAYTSEMYSIPNKRKLNDDYFHYKDI